MIKFVYIVNKRGQMRLSRYFEYQIQEVRNIMEADIIRSCMSRKDKQSNFMEYKDVILVYRKYINLFFVFGITADENELAVLELIHNFVETLDQYFETVSEIDILYNMDKVHMILDEMISNGFIVETSKERLLAPMHLIENIKK